MARLGSATIGESGGLAADRRLRPAWSGAAVAAPAYPVGCTPGDNLAVHVAVTTAPRGSVLVVDVGRVADRGYWGEVLTTAAEAAGLAGLVLDGGVRDVAALEAHGFPVFSATIALTGATKDKPGTVGIPVRVGGVQVALGDWVVADVDGVAFVPGDVSMMCWPPAWAGVEGSRFLRGPQVGLDDGGAARPRCLVGAPGLTTCPARVPVAQCDHE